MEIEVATTKKIKRCYHECPYFSVDGGPSGAMMCLHPKIKKQFEKTQNIAVYYIINHPKCDNGFPKKCPLLMKIKGKKS